MNVSVPVDYSTVVQGGLGPPLWGSWGGGSVVKCREEGAYTRRSDQGKGRQSLHTTKKYHIIARPQPVLFGRHQ